MVQEESTASECVCPDCGYRCNACLGTGTAVTREELQKLRATNWFTPAFNGAPDEDEPAEADVNPERPDGPAGF